MTEAEIIAGCRRGDRDAQQALYAMSADRVYRVLLRLTGNADDALELAQDTFIRVFDRIDQFDAASSVGTWVYRIAVNEGLQYLRRRKRHVAAVDELRSRPAGGTADDLGDRLDLQSALDALPEEDRALIVLRYFEGLDYRGIGEALEKPPGTVASGLNRARRLLRERLGEAPEGASEENAGVRHQRR